MTKRLFVLLAVVVLAFLAQPLRAATSFIGPGSCPSGSVITSTGGRVTTCETVPNLQSLRQCYVQRGLAATDDNFVFWMPPIAVTITGVGCRCTGNCGTLGTFTLEDDSGNAMTITSTNPTCAKTTETMTTKAVTAGNVLVANEGLAFDVTNTPSLATDWYTICVDYTVN